MGISRSCAAILAYLVHQNEQTLKVFIPWSRLRLQLPSGGGVRSGPGRKTPALSQGPNWGMGRGRVREEIFKSGDLPSTPLPWAKFQQSGLETEAVTLEA